MEITRNDKIILKCNDVQKAIQYAEGAGDVLGGRTIVTDCVSFKTPAAMAELLTSQEKHKVLIFYNIGQLDTNILDYLHGAILNNRIDIPIGDGKIIEIDINPFVCILLVKEDESLPVILNDINFKIFDYDKFGEYIKDKRDPINIYFIYFDNKSNGQKVPEDSFLFLCFSQKDQLNIYPLCKELDNMNLPYMINPISEFNGWYGIKENLSNIESAKLFMWVDSDNSRKDEYIADMVDYARKIKDNSEIIGFIIDTSEESIKNFCIKIEKQLGLDASGLLKKALDYQRLGDIEGGVNYLQKASDRGSLGAKALLGICYVTGNGVAKNPILAVKMLKEAANQGQSYAQLWLGYCYSNGDGVEQDDVLAASFFQKAADQGESKAQYEIGQCYLNGIGVRKDVEIAFKWFKKSSDQGNIDGQTELGLCYYYGRGVSIDYNKAVELFEKAAEDGHPKAQNCLGLCYQNGRGVKEDPKTAFQWYQKSAQQGYSNGQLNLGNCYYNGTGVLQNKYEATLWFEKAANQGNDQAACNLGWCYEHGEGVAEDFTAAGHQYLFAASRGFAMGQYDLGRMFAKGKDYKHAYEWYKKAADQGYGDAQCAIALMYKNGDGVRYSYAEAFKWLLKALESNNQWAKDILSSFSNTDLHNAACEYEKRKEFKSAYQLYLVAANRGFASSQCNIGWLYENGNGIPQDKEKAAKWYGKSAEQGNKFAQCNLAFFYEKGIGVHRDYSIAIKWYKKAANQGYGRAQYNLAQLYEKGLGTPVDINEAINWYEKAANQNYKDAREKADALIKENSLTNKIFKLFK